jgi:pyruvate/2-oxoglutarate dehydrogenase complex dihydrolipoamide dehydrogenase (E3) component
MTTTQTYDAIVIGTGQGGKPLALALGEAGWKTAVVERNVVGGTCINTGCTPTKTMVASARVAYLARRAADYGVHVGGVRVALDEVRRRKQGVVESFRGGSRKSLESIEAIDLLFGEASFEGPHQVRVKLSQGGETRLEADKIFINTGTSPGVPPIEGIADVPVLDNASIMELDELPEHLLVVGGGYVGLEFSQMFRRFGSRVTLVHRRSHLLPQEDPDVSEAIAGILQEDGVEVVLRSTSRRVERSASGGLRLSIDTPDGTRTLDGTHLLLATGRVPSSAALNLGAAGVEVDERGFIRSNPKLETSAPGVYVLGDVKGGSAFTHISYDDFRILRTNLLEGGDATIEGRLVPYTAFIDPQLGRVGLTETQARERGLDVRVATLPMKHVARAIEMDETRGFMKAVVDAGTGHILGCAILGVEGGEVMSVLQVAMMGGLPYQQIRDGIFAHPTLAESLNNLFMRL